MLSKLNRSFFTQLMTRKHSLVKQPLRQISHSNETEIQYEIVEPSYPISFPKRIFPADIAKPNYANHGHPNIHANKSNLKQPEDVLKIWHSCKIAKSILMTTGKQLKVCSAMLPFTKIDSVLFCLSLGWFNG